MKGCGNVQCAQTDNKRKIRYHLFEVVEEEDDHDLDNHEHDDEDKNDNEHLCRILFEVVANLPNVLLTIASRVGALVKELLQ